MYLIVFAENNYSPRSKTKLITSKHNEVKSVREGRSFSSQVL